jgi:hypothetical protein
MERRSPAETRPRALAEALAMMKATRGLPCKLLPRPPPEGMY